MRLEHDEQAPTNTHNNNKHLDILKRVAYAYIVIWISGVLVIFIPGFIDPYLNEGVLTPTKYLLGITFALIYWISLCVAIGTSAWLLFMPIVWCLLGLRESKKEKP